MGRMKPRKTFRFSDSEKFLKERAQMVRKAKGGFDDSHIDKKYKNRLSHDVFFCKFCGQVMYAAEYNHMDGALIMSCRKNYCPGNINCEKRLKINHLDLDVRLMTNQYFFNSRMKW